MSNDDLTDFVRQGLAGGFSRLELEQALTRAGWSVDQTRAALQGFADVGFPIPVPRPRPYLSAREGFIYIVMFCTLYLSAYNLGSILFELINRQLPDPALPSGSAEWTAAAIRWSVSSLIVAFPVFLYLSWLTSRDIRSDPAKRSSNVRKLTTYLTLLLGAGVLLGDVTTLVYNLLGGELTVRFILKAATVGGIAGAIFVYYPARSAGRGSRTESMSGVSGRLLLGIAALLVLAAIAAGLAIVGSPQSARQLQADRTRLDHLRQLSGQSTCTGRAVTSFRPRSTGSPTVARRHCRARTHPGSPTNIEPSMNGATSCAPDSTSLRQRREPETSGSIKAGASAFSSASGTPGGIWAANHWSINHRRSVIDDRLHQWPNDQLP